MPSQIAQLGMQAAGGIIGTGMGLLMLGHNDRRQLEQQEKLQNQQIAGNKQMVDYNMAKQLKMWKDTNYKAQIDEVLKAGLNPNAIFGHGGGGGITGQASGNVSGGEAPKGGGEVLGQQGMAIQRQMMQMQMENLQADTEKKKAEAKNIGTGTTGVDLDNELKAGKLKDELEIIKNRALQTVDELILKQTERYISQQTKEDNIKEIKANAIVAGLREALTKAMTANVRASTTNIGQATKESESRVKVNEQQIKVMEQQVKNMVEGLMIQWDKLSIESGMSNQVLLDKMLVDNDFPAEVIPLAKEIIEGILRKGIPRTTTKEKWDSKGNESYEKTKTY